MNIFDQFGIKEVADVTLYSIHKKQDGSGDNYFVPALFLDTLKISSVEKTAENVWAAGGLGNARLINWDYGKTINVSLEDALCTPASLGLCWGGVLSADWKDTHVEINSQACSCKNNVERVDTFQKAYYPRNDGKDGCVLQLLPHLKNDRLKQDLRMLSVSSVVDGTLIEGFGNVGCHSYKWRLDVESAVNSVAQVPDRFFDIKGRAYDIDMNRKVSVHSLPTYENYKDAIIYKINTKTKVAPILPKIIFDAALEDKGVLDIVSIELTAQEKSSMTFAELWENAGNIIHADGVLEQVGNESTYYYPLRSLTTVIRYTEKVDEAYDYEHSEKLFKILDENIINSITPEIISARAMTDARVNYNENHAFTDLCGREGQIDLDQIGSVEAITLEREICEGDYLAIIVDNEDNYHALIGVYAQKENAEPKDTVIWYKPKVPVDVSQFKRLDMWLRFPGLNAMVYFILTKYAEDIVKIEPAFVNANAGDETWAVDDKITTLEDVDEPSRAQGRLWAYVNPRTMQPYDDDYWFHAGEPYYIKSLTLSTPKRKIKANKITVSAGEWPGMYMLVGETWIRSYDTGKDERLQIKIPFCKVKSEHTLTLEAEGDPTTFNLELEVAKPRSGKMIEITAYESAQKMKKGENGCFYAVDGSSEIIFE